MQGREKGDPAPGHVRSAQTGLGRAEKIRRFWFGGEEMNRVLIMREKDFTEVKAFYWKLIEQMQGGSYLPGWEKGVYPSDIFLRESLRNRALYMLKCNGNYAAAMVLNHETNEGYSGTAWKVDADKHQVLIVHALGVLPAFQGKGVAKHMVKEVIRIAGERHQRAIRLDVLNGNVPALKLYESMGFEHRRTTQMFYEDTGWTDYLLYELVL